MEQKGYDDLLRKYKDRVQKEFGTNSTTQPSKVSSREYSEFKEELYPSSYTKFEKWCNLAEKILNIKPDQKKAEKTQKYLDTCHVTCTPAGVLSLAILVGILVMTVGSLLAFAFPMLLGLPPMMPLVFFCLIAGLIMIPMIQKIPEFMANTWRMKASNQMVQSVFYLVTYMRHTSNLERAIEFAADHLEPPLSLDFRKILWDVETQTFPTIRESANAYLQNWEESNKDFVEAFHLIESSLFEGSEDRRLQMLDKSLDVILDGTYENMLHYARELKAPMTMLNMLGIILPILGLVILPLVVSFMSNGSSPLVMAIYISLLYNIVLPASVYYLGRTILSKRPAGYGSQDMNLSGNDTSKVRIPLGSNIFITVNPLYISIGILITSFLIGFSPIVLHAIAPDFDIVGEKFSLLEYVCPPSSTGSDVCDMATRIGPFGIGAGIISVIFIAGLGLSIGLYYSLSSKNINEIRTQTKKLEDEFATALFQLGNRLADGLPAEIAFAKVAKTMQGTTSGEFFAMCERNMTKLGLGLEESIFDPKVGAISSYPSSVIESSMKVLIESSKKGPHIAAQALLSMSRYIKEIHRVEERLKDLMEEVISSMKSQVKFLTPAIAGIVIGITSMISLILTRLNAQLGSLAGGAESSGGMSGILSIFGIGIPTYHFQIIVGIYVVQLAIILTILANGIENGPDKAGERYALGQNVISGTLLYCFIAGAVIILFNLFASQIITKI